MQGLAVLILAHLEYFMRRVRDKVPPPTSSRTVKKITRLLESLAKSKLKLFFVETIQRKFWQNRNFVVSERISNEIHFSILRNEKIFVRKDFETKSCFSAQSLVNAPFCSSVAGLGPITQRFATKNEERDTMGSYLLITYS